MRLVMDWIGQRVVVRSSPSGVWLGTLLDAEDCSVKLGDARRAHAWEGAGSCSGLALTGPTGGRITAPVSSVVVMEVCEVIPATQQACAAWDAQPAWVGRDGR